MSKFIKLQIYFLILHINGRGCLATNSSINPRVVGGTDAKKEDIYFLVSVCFRKSRKAPFRHECGGSLITQRAVVAAASCVTSSSRPTYYKLDMGILNRFQETKDTLNFKVKKIIAHKDFDSVSLENDIAIFIAKGRVPHKHFVRPIKLPKYKAAPNSSCQILGWGSTTATSSSLSNIAKKATVELFSQNYCVNAYPNISLTGMICAGNKEGGVDSCEGDLGGPLIQNNTLIGIVSWGEECAEPGYPGVYTDVFHFREWIIRNSSERNAFSILYIILITVILKFTM